MPPQPCVDLPDPAVPAPYPHHPRMVPEEVAPDLPPLHPDANPDTVLDDGSGHTVPPPSAGSWYPQCTRSGTWHHGPALDRSMPEHCGQWITGMLSYLLATPGFVLMVACQWGQYPPNVTNVGSSMGPV